MHFYCVTYISSRNKCRSFTETMRSIPYGFVQSQFRFAHPRGFPLQTLTHPRGADSCCSFIAVMSIWKQTDRGQGEIHDTFRGIRHPSSHFQNAACYTPQDFVTWPSKGGSVSRVCLEPRSTCQSWGTNSSTQVISGSPGRSACTDSQENVTNYQVQKRTVHWGIRGGCSSQDFLTVPRKI